MLSLTIEPNDDLLGGIGVLRGEEPEVQLARLVRLVRNGEQASVRLSNIEVDLRDGRAIDRKL